MYWPVHTPSAHPPFEAQRGVGASDPTLGDYVVLLPPVIFQHQFPCTQTKSPTIWLSGPRSSLSMLLDLSSGCKYELMIRSQWAILENVDVDWRKFRTNSKIAGTAIISAILWGIYCWPIFRFSNNPVLWHCEDWGPLYRPPVVTKHKGNNYVNRSNQSTD